MTGPVAIGLPDHVETATVAVAAAGLLLVVSLLLRIRLMTRAQRRAIEELQHSTIHVAAIVDSAMDAIIAMDQDGRITQWNPQAERLLGWHAEDMLGRQVGDTIVPPRWRLEHEKGVSHLNRTGEGHMLGRSMEVAALRRDGSEVAVDLSINLGVRDGARATYVAFLRDVTQRQKAERIQALRFVVASVLSDAESAAEAADGVLAAIGTRLRARLVALWTPTLGGLASERQWCAEPGELEALLRATRAATVAIGNGLPGRAWSTARPLTLDEVPSTHEDFERLRLAAESGLRGAVAVPVSSGERVLAVIEVFTAAPDNIDEELLRTLADVGGQLGQQLARRRAEALQESPERLSALLEHATEAAVTVADDGAIVALNERARRLLGYTTLEVMGEDLRVLVAERDRDLVIEYVSETLDHAHGAATVRRWCDLGLRRKDGALLPMGLHITPLAVAGRRLFLCLLLEPSAAERHEQGELRVLRHAEGESRPRPA